ncbi:unnamed protein product [Lymnaea stagnalis]|uniref:Uncharacterized protein n=1 Tax=Lymnaea stagnalis TaxID=6523 RepID=A0AAV2HAP5_LYMST
MAPLQKCLIVTLVLGVLIQSFCCEAASRLKQDDQESEEEAITLDRFRRNLAQMHVGSIHYNHQATHHGSRRHNNRRTRIHTEAKLASA